jgi:hypothetical protein
LRARYAGGHLVHGAANAGDEAFVAWVVDGAP